MVEAYWDSRCFTEFCALADDLGMKLLILQVENEPVQQVTKWRLDQCVSAIAESATHIQSWVFLDGLLF